MTNETTTTTTTNTTPTGAMIDLDLLAQEIRAADERLYGMALAAGVVGQHHANSGRGKTVAQAASRTGYETARDLAFDAARIGVVGSILQFGLIEVTPLLALCLMIILASVFRLVIQHIGEI